MLRTLRHNALERDTELHVTDTLSVGDLLWEHATARWVEVADPRPDLEAAIALQRRLLKIVI